MPAEPGTPPDVPSPGQPPSPRQPAAGQSTAGPLRPAGRGPAQSCPRHGTTEDIRQVAVVYADLLAGDEADLLSPRPVLKAADRLAWTGTGFGVAGMVAIWAGNAIGGGATGPALAAGIICFAYALAMYGWAAARRARLTRVERGVPAALALWRNAWYCERCDGVFFPGGELMSASDFRGQVWSAGGYGDLLEPA